MYASGIRKRKAGCRKFSRNCAVDLHGNPLALYRGQSRFEYGVESKIGSITFAMQEASARMYAKGSGLDAAVIKAHLVIRNPIVNTPDDRYIEYSHLIDRLGLKVATDIALQQEDWIKCTSVWEEVARERPFSEVVGDADSLSHLYSQAWPILDDHGIVETMRSAGYDGAIHASNGATLDDVEYKVFDLLQVLPLSVVCPVSHTQ